MTNSERFRIEVKARILKALAHPTRLYIIDKLKLRTHCVCELTDLVGADTSTVSKHLSILKNAGLVESRKEGTMVHYSLADECVVKCIGCLGEIAHRQLERQVACLADEA